MEKGALEFNIKPRLGALLLPFFRSQLFVTPRIPQQSFAGQTVVITGANSGLGLEAACHFFRLHVAKLILAVRSTDKGQAAKEEIVKRIRSRSDGDTAIEVWTVDVGTTESTLAFAERVKEELPRVDVLLCNAGVNPRRYELVEGYELSMQINVFNTFLLALSLLPKLNDTKRQFPDTSPHLVIVGSDACRLTKFVEINSPDIYEAFNDESTFDGQARYQDSKLIQVLVHREIVSRLEAGTGPSPVTFNVVHPGLCVSNIFQNFGNYSLGTRIVHKLLFRTAEVGSRTLVDAACKGPRSHGRFLADTEPVELDAWISTDMGNKAQKKTFEQTMKILESRRPGIAAQAGIRIRPTL
ncbi:NAD(P)-binding protein [Xylaria intraflava]|nr:NAD(P)-binding protein [Xylaria intraflava]